MAIRSQTNEVLVEVNEGIVTVTLNRPDKLNAMTQAMQDTIDMICHSVSDDDKAKVLIITGSGRGFCVGFDVTAPMGKHEASRKVRCKPIGWQILSLYNCTKPTIAAINGITGGMANAIIAACDIRIASDAARFGAFWSGVGLIPDSASTYLLPRLIGLDRALEFFYTNDIIDANDALRIGLVTKVVPHDELMKASIDLALKIAKGPSVALELGKQVMRDGLQNTIETQLNYETHAQECCQKTGDFKEAIKAFQEKRPVQFKGK